MKNYQFCYPLRITERRKKFENKNNGILFFVDENETSKICPQCNKKLNRSKQNGDDHLYHNDNNPAGPECAKNPFEIKKVSEEYESIIEYILLIEMTSQPTISPKKQKNIWKIY